MALGTGSSVVLESSLLSMTFKVSETLVAELTYAEPLRLVEFTGSGNLSTTDYVTPILEFYQPQMWCPQEPPFSNRQLVLLADSDNSPPGDVWWYIGLVDVDPNTLGVCNLYLSGRIEILTPSSTISDVLGIVMVTASQGYALVVTGADNNVYKISFSVSGNTITEGSCVAVSGADITADYPIMGYGLGDGRVVQFWAKEVSGFYHQYFDIVTGGSIGSGGTLFDTGLTDPDTTFGFSDRIACGCFDLNTPGILYIGYQSYGLNRMLRFDPTVLVGDTEAVGPYPPNNQDIKSAAILSLGAGGQGLFAWSEDSGSSTTLAYAALIDPDSTTGDLNVDQGSRISTANVQYHLGLWPMLDGTEAAMIFREDVGGASTQLQVITGLPGYVVPPPGDTGKRLWVYKGNGIDWSSRGLKVAD